MSAGLVWFVACRRLAAGHCACDDAPGELRVDDALIAPEVLARPVEHERKVGSITVQICGRRPEYTRSKPTASRPRIDE
jgi:hypothetical protein